MCKIMSLTLLMASDGTSNVRLLSYNCRGYNVYKKPYLAELLSKCEVLFLQEHWLCGDQLSLLSEISDTHNVYSVCGFDSATVLRGRPYGGCAIFWRNNMSVCVDQVDTNNSRICAVHMYDNTGINFLLVNVYMPFVSTDDAYDEFCVVLSIVEHLTELHPDAVLILGGDFNVDFERCTSHSTMLDSFCGQWNLASVVSHPLSNIDFTYNFSMKRFSVLDHFFIPTYIFDSCVQSVSVIHDIDNCSDHDPLCLHLNICWSTLLFSTRRAVTKKPAWYKANETDLENYKRLLQSNLNTIAIPRSALACHDVKCCDKNHHILLKEFADNIAEASLTAAVNSVPLTGNMRNDTGKKSTVPGWQEYVAPARAESLFWHNLWIECGRPHSGSVADCMRRTRAAYHYAIRHVRRNETEIIQERFARSVLQNSNRDFWSEVKRIKNAKKGVNGIIDGVCDSSQIANLFADKYEDLYASVPYSSAEMEAINDEINSDLDRFTPDCVISFNDVVEAVKCMKYGKNDGYVGLSTNHVKYGPDELFVHISMLFSSMLVHGVVTSDLLVSSIIPIPKGGNVNRADSNNYRGIALSSIYGKILDRIILNRYADILVTSEHQFGFKKGHSTSMCTMILKETVDYYTFNRGTVFCTLLDATKAFDRIKYCKLFRCLIDRKLPSVVVRLLMSMYTSHVTRIVWNGVQSRWFGVMNGVKQGGVLSPVLFCVYVDGLLKALTAAGVGCFIGNIFTGVLAYADDIVLLSPTASAMRKMLYVCEGYAAAYSMVFNATKSKCIVCESRYSNRSNSRVDNTSLSFTISGSSIEIVGSWTHLGHVISCDSDDRLDIINRCEKFILQINSVLCTFNQLDAIVKTELLKSYCLSLYGCELWDLSNPALDKSCKSWRSGLKRVWGLPYNCRSAILHIISDTVPLYDLMCKRSIMFTRRCLQSESPLVKSVACYAVYHGRMTSTLGRNIHTCSQHFSSTVSALLSEAPTFICRQRYTDDMYKRALATFELIMLRHGILSVPDLYVSNEDMRHCIASVCT